MDFQPLIVPRHPQRFDEVAALIERHGPGVARCSQWTGSPVASDKAMNADVWLGDSLGEMALYDGLSDACLLGGSFAPLGRAKPDQSRHLRLPGGDGAAYL